MTRIQFLQIFLVSKVNFVLLYKIPLKKMWYHKSTTPKFNSSHLSFPISRIWRLLVKIWTEFWVPFRTNNNSVDVKFKNIYPVKNINTLLHQCSVSEFLLLNNTVMHLNITMIKVLIISYALTGELFLLKWLCVRYPTKVLWDLCRAILPSSSA